MTDTLTDSPAIDFQLRLAGTTGADAAAETRQMGPLSCQTRQQILKLRQFDLELAFIATSALGEDVEDQLASIDDPQLERFLQIALLRRGEIFVEDRKSTRLNSSHSSI